MYSSYPTRGLRPWGTWGKESRNVFCPHIPYRYAAAQNRGRATDMMHSCPGLPIKNRIFFLRPPPSIFFGHSPRPPGTHTCTNREDAGIWNFFELHENFIKLHQLHHFTTLMKWSSGTSRHSFIKFPEVKFVKLYKLHEVSPESSWTSRGPLPLRDGRGFTF
jgi:hypothetical protein